MGFSTVVRSAPAVVPKKLLVGVGDKCPGDTRGAVTGTLDIPDDDTGLVAGTLRSTRSAAEETLLITRLRYDSFKKCKSETHTYLHVCIVFVSKLQIYFNVKARVRKIIVSSKFIFKN